MFSARNHSRLRKTQSRRQTTKSNQHSRKRDRRTPATTISSSLINRFHEILTDLKRPGSRFLSYTITELEPICQQIAIQQMSATRTVIEYCPFTCIFCQNFIYEPITLYCGHTFCDKCIETEDISSTNNCPRCPDDIQGQIQSSIVDAREKGYRKNRLLIQLFEHSETLKTKCQLIAQCHEGQVEYSKGNYQQAIDIYSKILDQYANDHYALYNRAKAYSALKEYERALSDATQVILLRPQWPKGYLCQSEVLFEMKHFAAALMSSLKALVIDPEDPVGKQIMARHLHTVLHNSDDKESVTNMDSELEQFNIAPLSHNDTIERTSSEASSNQLTICNSAQSTNVCFCSQFDYKNLNLRDFDCSICVSLLWFPITTPCGHVFCRECLIRSIDNTQIQCPICKNSLTEFFPMLIQSHVNKTVIISKIIETYFPTEYNERRQLFEQENLQGTSIPRSVITTSEPTSFEIPVFVCVLTNPYVPCPLHVFEPRYRLMMRRTVETESRSFGMCTYDEETRTFADYGTLLYIRGLIYTRDGRSIVDTIGQRRFHVIERGTRDGYCTARVELIRDHPVEQHEFDDLLQMNRVIYSRARNWFDQLDDSTKTKILQNIGEYPPCEDLTQESTDGPRWSWIVLNILPIEELLQYTALASQSYRVRLQIINDAIDFLLNQRHPTMEATSANNEEQT